MSDQIALWSQRRLAGKLHLPAFTAEIKQGQDGKIDYSASLNTLQQFPICGRQLNNHREAKSQLADKLEFAGSLEEFVYQLLSRKGCRHCAIKAGLLVRPTYSKEPGDDTSESEETGDE